MQKLLPKHINRRESVCYKLHLIYSILEGSIEGVFLLSSFVFVKALLGGDYQISLLFQSMVGIYIVSVFVNQLLARVTNLKRMLLISGVVTRIPLFLFLSFDEESVGNNSYHVLFLMIFAVFYSSRTFIFPVINLFLKQSYRSGQFGKLFGYASTYRKAVIIFVTFLFGLLCDFDPFAFRYIFPLCGVIGVVSLYLFTRIPFAQPEVEEHKLGVVASVKQVFFQMLTIAKGNIPYKHFELSFMLYGLGFMLTFPVITIYFENVLELTYSSVSFYQYWFNTISVLLLPLFGRLLGKMDPRTFGVLTFGAMLLYVLCFILVDFWDSNFSIGSVHIYWALLIGYSSYGVFMASNALLYHIGSSYFCEKEHAATYQSLHLSLTGVRGLLFPLLGVWVYQQYGFVLCFALAGVSLIGSILLLLYSQYRMPLNR